jgi:hypothetical protein
MTTSFGPTQDSLLFGNVPLCTDSAKLNQCQGEERRKAVMEQSLSAGELKG